MFWSAKATRRRYTHHAAFSEDHMTKRLFAAIASTFLMLISCHSDRSTTDAVRIGFDQLSSVRNESVVHICGWFQAAYETCSLSTSQSATMFPDPRHIWVRPKTSICDPVEVVERPIGSWAELTGKLFVSEGQGHLGSYSYSLSDATVQFREAPCP